MYAFHFLQFFMVRVRDRVFNFTLRLFGGIVVTYVICPLKRGQPAVERYGGAWDGFMNTINSCEFCLTSRS